MLAIYLRPGAASAFLEMPLDEITDGVAPLEGLWKKPAIPPEQLTLDAVESLLLRQLARAKSAEPAKHIASLSSHVARAGGALSVAEMSRLTGLSRQHLRRLFLRYVGVSPKLFSRLARFRAGPAGAYL